MQFPTLLAFLALPLLAISNPIGPVADPAGAKNVGNGKGLQFITGGCLSNADCASTCCAGPNGVCSGIDVGNAAGKTGCGFTAAGAGAAAPAPAATVAAAPAATANVASTGSVKSGPVGDPAGAKNVGNGKGLQFITGGCLSDADCASTCCAGPNGVCSAVAVANVSGKTGCGFVAAGKL